MLLESSEMGPGTIPRYFWEVWKLFGPRKKFFFLVGHDFWIFLLIWSSYKSNFWNPGFSICSTFTNLFRSIHQKKMCRNFFFEFSEVYLTTISGVFFDYESPTLFILIFANPWFSWFSWFLLRILNKIEKSWNFTKNLSPPSKIESRPRKFRHYLKNHKKLKNNLQNHFSRE